MPWAENRLAAKTPLRSGCAASEAVTISAARAGSLLLNSVADVLDVRVRGDLLLEAGLASVGRGDPRVDTDDHHLALFADHLGEGICSGHATLEVVGGDSRHADRLVVDDCVDEDHLDPGILSALQRPGRRLDVVGRDEDGIGLARHDGVDDRILQRGVEGIRAPGR